MQRESAVDAQSAKGLAVWHLKRVLCCSAWSGLAQLQRERAHRFILAGAHVPGTVRPGTTYAGAFQQANSLLAQAAAVNHLTAICIHVLSLRHARDFAQSINLH